MDDWAELRRLTSSLTLSIIELLLFIILLCFSKKCYNIWLPHLLQHCAVLLVLETSKIRVHSTFRGIIGPLLRSPAAQCESATGIATRLITFLFPQILPDIGMGNQVIQREKKPSSRRCLALIDKLNRG